MSNPMIYLETSFFRYLIARPRREEPKSSRQKLTRDWWQDDRHKYGIYISNTVFIEFCEMAAGRIPDQEASERLALLQQAESLPIESAMMELAASLVLPLDPLPRKAAGGKGHPRPWRRTTHPLFPRGVRRNRHGGR